MRMRLARRVSPTATDVIVCMMRKKILSTEIKMIIIGLNLPEIFIICSILIVMQVLSIRSSHDCFFMITSCNSMNGIFLYIFDRLNLTSEREMYKITGSLTF